MKLREFTAFFNKQYRDQPDGSFLHNLQQAFLEKLLDINQGKSLPEHVFYADDCFVVYRNLGFLKDEDFQLALRKAKVDKVIMGRVWRLWLLAWSMHSRWKTEGSFVDCGTYNGCALEVGLNYCVQKLGARDGAIFACDLFENPPNEARKVEHGPHLHETVEQRIAHCGDTIVVKGALPGSLDNQALGNITWCQIDLNSAAADADTFRALLSKLTDGAMVIFDDYGFSRYSDTQKELDIIANALGNRILELPTGQGLYIHKC
jgi:O-methyltransferase